VAHVRFYIGVVVYSFVAAFDVGGEPETISALVPIVALLLLIVAVFLYRTLQTRAFESVKLASVLADVARHGHDVMGGVYPDERPQDEQGDSSPPFVASGPGREVCWHGPAGILQAVDVPLVIRTARQAEATIEFTAAVGSPVYPRCAVARIHGEAGLDIEKALLGALRVGQERTFEQDPTLAFRLLVDIAIRALSPAVNDPITAVQVLDTLEDLLRALLGRDLDVGAVTGPQGRHVRVVLRLPSWGDYVVLSFEEIIASGGRMAPVRRRAERLLNDLIAVAPVSRRPPLAQQLQSLMDLPWSGGAAARGEQVDACFPSSRLVTEGT
jgi:uncharacterized membrane protein